MRLVILAGGGPPMLPSAAAAALDDDEAVGDSTSSAAAVRGAGTADPDGLVTAAAPGDGTAAPAPEPCTEKSVSSRALFIALAVGFRRVLVFRERHERAVYW